MTNHTISPDYAFSPSGNFVGCLRNLAASRPDDLALVVVEERSGELIETEITYLAFDQRVRALAALLQGRFDKGDRVLILLDNDSQYAISMFACFFAGVIAVPAFPPESTRPQHLARLMGIAADAQARGILTASAIHSLISGAAAQFGVSAVIAVDEADPAQADAWRPQEPALEDVAFLQYTSGSTSSPKGVMVTHGCLMANERAIREGLSIGADDKFGVWSPLFHDMGLIGGLLQPFYSGIPCVLCSPRFFLERPVRWLEMVSRHRVTISGGPDFAYRLCLDRVKDTQLDGLDLSSWRIAYTGAEPVRHDTMDAFIERYAPAGFDAGAVYPCYGLAEATLFITGGRRGSGMTVNRFDDETLSRRLVTAVADGSALVGCGQVPSSHQIRIADPDSGDVAAAAAIGEIWATGPSIAAGYWNKPNETAQAFLERDGHRWLRTGDLGFVHEGELFVAGRLKDMIIVRGHNLYPQDIERAVEAEVDAVRKGRVAAFAVNVDGQEGIGIAAEVSRGLQKLIAPQALADVLGAVVSEQCGEAPKAIVLLNPGALPKTSSGKLQRGACRKGWMDRSLDAYAIFEGGRAVGGQGGGEGLLGASVAPLDEMAQVLAAVWRDVLKHDAARPYAGDTHFFASGGNSLAAVQLAAHIARRWEIDFPPRLVFEHPRLQEQAEAIRRSQEAGVRGSAPAIPVLPAERRIQPLPLSSAQRRQWFMWQLDPQSTAYHIQGALRLKGKLDFEALRAAIAGLVQRHESLRTVFRVRPDGEVEQIVLPERVLDLQLIDLRQTADTEREERMAEALHALNVQPFVLTDGPLVRAALVRLTEQIHVLALVMHHIVSDGASMQILVDELGVLYAVSFSGELGAPTLASPAIQYADYAAWQHDHLDKETHERQLAYWRKQLNVAPEEAHPVLTLPVDHPRQAVLRYRAADYRFELPTDLLAGLRRLTEMHGATLFTVLLAGFHALLYRYSGQHDIRVGVPVANRGRPELQDVIGLFVNTLVMRLRLDGRTSFAQALEQAREAVLGAQANQDLPFEQLVEALQPGRSLSHTPLFQVMFNHLQEDYGAFARRTGLTVEGQGAPGQEAQFELTLDTREYPDGSVGARLTYAKELFEEATIARMAGHYVAVLEALATQAQQAVGEVALLGEAEREQLQAWGVNPQRYPDTEPVHQLIERQAQAHPEATAVIFGETALTYGELNARANRLAHHLIGRGVAPETKVGIAVERSLEMVVGLLAILKAGGAYVPLDPEYPADRLAYMVEDSGLGLLLTQGGVRDRIPTPAGVGVIELDTLVLADEPAENPQVVVQAESLAYVIYTSGSTGKPKGAAIRHRALSSCMTWMQQTYGLTAADTVLHKAPFCFDVSVWEIFWPLTAGVRLVVSNPGDHRDPARITELILKHEITTLNFVPAMLQAFLAHEGIEAQTRLRYVICGGEAMPAATQSEALRRLKGVSLQNLYGPTETTIHVTRWTCRDDSQSLVPIGQPISETQAHVLDESMNRVPQGVAGELHIGGELLARGYLNRPGLSAERFVADPFDEGGGRLYRTGDLVRWNGVGQLEYLGRIDHQVKIRGFRIELGEVEAQLLSQEEVREAVVVAQAGPSGSRLVGYVSLQAGQAIEAGELRDRLGEAVPDYMVPSAIVVLEALPLNANGKVDRKALPEPEFGGTEGYEAPQGEVEEALAAIWAEVLGVERVGRHDNFFDVGGHSLQLIRVHRLLKERLQADLSLMDLFKHPTIDALVERIVRGADERAEAEASQRDIDAAQRRRTALLQRKKHMERIA